MINSFVNLCSYGIIGERFRELSRNHKNNIQGKELEPLE